MRGKRTKESPKNLFAVFGDMCIFALRDMLLALEASWTTFTSENRRRLCIMLLFVVYIIKESFASCVLESACFT